MKRNHEIRIKLSEEELAVVKRKAEQTGMSLSSLARFLLKNSYLSVTLGE